MPKRETEQLKRVHLWIYERDYDRLHAFFDGRIKISDAVRQILHNYLNQIEAKAGAVARPMELKHDLTDITPSEPVSGS
jgi:hypothetical protein